MTEHDTILKAVQTIMNYMRLESRIEITQDQDGKGVLVSVYSPEQGRLLIGKNGQSLKALEHIVRLLAAKHTKDLAITLDVNDYKKSKAQYALELARQALGRVRNTQKAEALIPMTPYERRVVHMELASCPDITTESIGEEPQRRVVIKPFP
jgi:spoIIIJ-associated protein